MGKSDRHLSFDSLTHTDTEKEGERKRGAAAAHSGTRIPSSPPLFLSLLVHNNYTILISEERERSEDTATTTTHVTTLSFTLLHDSRPFPRSLFHRHMERKTRQQLLLWFLALKANSTGEREKLWLHDWRRCVSLNTLSQHDSRSRIHLLRRSILRGRC